MFKDREDKMRKNGAKKQSRMPKLDRQNRPNTMIKKSKKHIKRNSNKKFNKK